MRSRLFILLFSITGMSSVWAQPYTRQTYHDAERKNLKEIYQVKDTVRNILHGRYISYYLNGSPESKGQFANNETVGIWEFFYESGNLKMRGVLRQNSNFGLWEYFYESGSKSMEGTINGKNREGVWKMYFENGQVKETGEYKSNRREGLWISYFEDGVKHGEIEYTDDFGRYTEYYHSGKVAREGPKIGTKLVGHWRYFAEDGTLQSEGDYENNKRQNEWITYYPSGALLSKGRYENDVPVGKWEYFFEDGKISSSGEYLGGQKQGYWSSYSDGGSLINEATYNRGTGEYREYYSSGKLKVKGLIVDNHREGHWDYFYEDGKREGECDFTGGKGTYLGYYPDGTLQTKGQVDDDKRVGTWEIYERDGKLSGYYKPFYNDKNVSKEIAELAKKEPVINKVQGRRFTYFDARSNEFRGVILGGNPVLMFAGRFPMGIEFYSQERLGHEFEFIGIRDPFFQADENIPIGKQFERGYAIAIKQKFYNPVGVGMWYFGHEVRFSNLGHFTNVAPQPENVITISATDQRIQYGIMLGYRIMQRNNRSGFTIDMFCSADIGYRSVEMQPSYESFFSDINTDKFVSSLHVGLNLGNVFSSR